MIDYNGRNVAHEHVPNPVIEGIELLVFRENSIQTSAA
jgi:hypothetical protein